MANYAVITKVIMGDAGDTRADTVAGSLAKAISDYLETVDTGKTIRGITQSAHGQKVTVIIIHDS